jgi:hypothetical protein
VTNISFLPEWPAIDKHPSSVDSFMLDNGERNLQSAQSVVCILSSFRSETWTSLIHPAAKEYHAVRALASFLFPFSSIDDDHHIQAVLDIDLAVHIEASHMTDVQYRCNSWMFQTVQRMVLLRRKNFQARYYALVLWKTAAL